MIVKMIAILIGLLVFPFYAFAAVQTLYVSPSGSGDCSVGSPCSLSTALSTVADGDGDTIILDSGTYASGFDLTDTTHHDNLTITTTTAVISGLGTFTKGIPSGTDNRPLIGGPISVSDGVSGVNLKYLKVRGNVARASGFTAVIYISEYPTTIDHCQIYYGGSGIHIYTVRGITISECDIRENGVTDSSDYHGIGVYNFNQDAPAASFTDGIIVDSNTFYDNKGDGMQALSAAATGNNYRDKYITFSNNNISYCKEDGFDMKGAQYVKIYGNEISYSYIGINSNDFDSSWTSGYQIYVYIWNNIIHHNTTNAIRAWYNDYWYIWNNLIYNNSADHYWNTGTIDIACNTSCYFVHNVLANNNNTVDYSEEGAGQQSGIYSYDSGTTIKNNILFNNGQCTWCEGNINGQYSEGIIDYNYLYPSTAHGGWSSQVHRVGTDSDTTPGFIGGSPYNWRVLASSSVCDNAGTDLTGDATYTIDTDKDGLSRDTSPWLGAYESEGTATPPSAQGCTISGGTFR